MTPKVTPLRSLAVLLWALFALGFPLNAQSANTSQQLVFAGLRSIAGQGQINGVKTDTAGNLYLLIDQGDGVRLLKTDNAATTVLAQVQLGAQGDSGIALALDRAGNVYITGTSSSTVLTATSGAAIPNRTDASTNSFVARFDSALHPVFVTFTGGSRIAASSIAATSDAVFVTGITYASNLPVTPNGIQQAPAYGSTQNGFVERFSADGGTLVYATYLTGATGDTTPRAIVADAADNAYIAGATTASGFPAIAALVPAILSTPSGFLAKLTPAGDATTASTFIPGPGLSSLALDSTGQILLVTGSVALGQFPVDTVTTPLIPTTYQVLLRLPLALNAVQSGTLIAPATQSNVAAAPNGDAWVDGNLTIPLLPMAPLANLGSGFAVRVTSVPAIDQTARFGGLPNASSTYASLPALIAAVAVDPGGEPLIAGAMQPTASSSLLASESYDIPLRNGASAAFPSAIRDAEPTATTCNGSLCFGSAAYLAKLNANASAASLAFSMDAVPFIVLRNLGSAEADNLQLTVSAGTFNSNCAATLYPGGECNILLSGGSSGTLTASFSTGTQTASFAAFSAVPPKSTIVFSPKELDFGILTSASASRTRTINVSNLGTTSQSFTSALDAFSNSKIVPSSPFFEYSGDCPLTGSATTKTLPPGGTCHVVLGLQTSSSAANDGILQANWSIGTGDVLLTGYSQAVALSVSAPEIDFGTQFTTGIHLPRFLYLSNSSAASVSHAALSLPSGSPFSLTDACPSTLLPASVCRIRIDYLAAQSTSTDSTNLVLDQGLSVLVTGNTLPAPAVTSTTVNPNLSVTPASITFATPTVITGVSGSTQTVSITNTGASAFGLSLALTGDFTQATSCGASLPTGQTCAVALTFAPSQPGSRSGLLAITAGAGTSPTYVTLTATGTALLAANNTALDSGSIPIGQPTTQFYKVNQPFTALTLTATGPYTVTLIEDIGYGHGQPPSSSFLATGTGGCHNCFLGVRFQPTAAGPQPGTLTITSAAGGTPYVFALTGTGLPLSGLLLTPAAVDFGTASVHSSSGPALFTLINLSPNATAVTISPPSLTGDFYLSSVATGGQACGGTLAYAASCYVEVTFNPTAIGTRTGSLTFAASGLSATASLTGLATADPGLAINPLSLTFNAVSGISATFQTITLTNTSTNPLQVGNTSATSSFQSATTCATLAPGTSCSISVTFQPAPAAVTGTLSIPTTITPAGSPPQSTIYSVSLNGTYTSSTSGLEILPAVTLYGPSPVDSVTTPRIFTINNLTAKSTTLNISIPRQFVLVGPPCTTLAPNASCSFSVAFLPLTNNDTSGTLFAQATPSDGTPTLSGLAYVEGFGTGSGALAISGGLIANGVFDFGQVSSGQTRPQIFTLTNANPAGSSPIAIRRITSAPPFLSTTTCTASLAPAQSCTVTVTYTPSNQVANGASAPNTTADAGTLIIESDAASSPDLLNLAGQAGPTAGASSASPLATFTLSQGSLTFASTAVGNASPAQSITLANTGNVILHVFGLTSPTDFTVQGPCTSIPPAATCTFSVSSTPQAAGTHIGALEITSDSATSLEFVSLISTAIPAPVTLTPTSLNFGSLVVGTSATLPVQVTNTAATPAVFTSVATTGDYTTSGTCPNSGNSLAPNATCTIQVVFTPAASGTRTGVLSVATSSTTLPLTVSLTGVGNQSKLLITPSSLAFGTVTVGAASNLSLTLQNNGTAPVTNLFLTTSPSDYAVTTPCPQTTLAVGATCTVQVTFVPSAQGSRPGTLTVTSSDPSSPLAIPLTGTGVQGGGSFALTVDGGLSSIATVVSGSPATFHLTLTPSGGYTGIVTLTCAPIVLAQYASCSVLPATIALTGTPQLSIATINTVTSAGGNATLLPLRRTLSTPFLCLTAPGLLLLWKGRRNFRRRIPLLLAMILASAAFLFTGCGSKANPNLRYTPAGTYQYQVTATSTSGVQITQTVTLNLVVTPR